MAALAVDDLNPSHGGLLNIALVCCLLAVLGSAVHIYLHLRHFTERAQQQHIVRILLIVPIYALLSWLSLRFPDQELYFATVRDCYEAYVVYCFLALVLVYCGGDGVCVAGMQEKGSIAHPWPLCRLPRIKLNGLFLRHCKQAVLQFVIIKPLFAIASLALLAVGSYGAVWYQAILLLVYNVSYSAALYALLLFYMACREQLSAFSPVCKFFAVKSIVFMTYWQGLAVELVPGIPGDLNGVWQDFVLCIEMVLFMILHVFAFSYRVAAEFVLRDGVVHTTVMQNMRHIINQKDVVQDAYHNFMPSYQDYVLHRPYAEAPPRKYRARTFIFGNLGRKAKKTPMTDQDGLAERGHALAVDMHADADDADDDDNDGAGSASEARGTQIDVSMCTSPGDDRPRDTDTDASTTTPLAAASTPAVRADGTDDDDTAQVERKLDLDAAQPVADATSGVSNRATLSPARDSPSPYRDETPRRRFSTASSSGLRAFTEGGVELSPVATEPATHQE